MFQFRNMSHQSPLGWTSFCSAMLVLLSLFFLSSNSVMALSRNLHDNLRVTWGEGRSNIINDGKLVSVALDRESGSGFESKREYLFAKIDIEIKLVSGNSAGTVTAYYLSSEGYSHDEIDFEFLGNVSGDPYTLHTNVFCQGKGNREQQFRLWFDPTADFHTYSIYWTPLHILFLVDGIPIREFKNMESFEIPYPKNQPMRVYASLWNADDWATRGGLVKTDWSKAPFNAYFRNFTGHEACSWTGGASSCRSRSAFSSYNNNAWQWDKLDDEAEGKMKWIQRKYMVYNYCTDTNRFPQGLPKECYLNNFNY